MKKSVLLLALMSLVSVNVFARPNLGHSKGFDLIDMTKKFESTSHNLYNDGDTGHEGVDILVWGTYKEDFLFKLEKSGDVSRCEMTAFQKLSGPTIKTIFRVAATTEVDDGSACNVIIKYRNGKTAKVEIYSTGT